MTCCVSLERDYSHAQAILLVRKKSLCSRRSNEENDISQLLEKTCSFFHFSQTLLLHSSKGKGTNRELVQCWSFILFCSIFFGRIGAFRIASETQRNESERFGTLVGNLLAQKKSLRVDSHHFLW